MSQAGMGSKVNPNRLEKWHQDIFELAHRISRLLMLRSPKTIPLDQRTIRENIAFMLNESNIHQTLISLNMHSSRASW